MYHPQCELLMPHEALDLTAGPSHLAVTAAPSAIPGELNFHFLHSLDTAAPAATASSQPSMDYFAGEPVQFEQLAPHHQMSMIREYYGHCHGHYSTESFPRSGSLVFGAAGAVDDAAAYVMGNFDSPSPQRAGGGKRRRRGGALGPPNGVEKKEKQRRQRLTEKFTALMLLIPNRTKEDRATVIADAIEYIRELGRTVEELTLLVDKKRRRRDIQGDVVDAPPAVAAAAGDAEGSEVEVAAATALAQRQPIRSTYIQRRSKETFVDVRIVEDEVNIKLTKRRRDGCLAAASRALDELRLDLIHVSGGKIGDCHIYMFNAKIHQGSSVFASAVASKLIEVVDEY